MARIATVYSPVREPWIVRDMSFIRWQKISEGLAGLGHDVDIVTNEPRWQENSAPVEMCERVRRVPLQGIDWNRYDVIKTSVPPASICWRDTEEAGIHSLFPSWVQLSEPKTCREFISMATLGASCTRLKSKFIAPAAMSPAERARPRTLASGAWRPERAPIGPGAVDHDIPNSPRNPLQNFRDKVCLPAPFTTAAHSRRPIGYWWKN